MKVNNSLEIPPKCKEKVLKMETRNFLAFFWGKVLKGYLKGGVIRGLLIE